MSYDDAKYTQGVKLIAEQVIQMCIEDGADAADEEDFIAGATSDIEDEIQRLCENKIDALATGDTK